MRLVGDHDSGLAVCGTCATACQPCLYGSRAVSHRVPPRNQTRRPSIIQQKVPAVNQSINMGTLKGFPNPALWLRRARPAFSYAIMGTLKGFAPPFGPPPATSSPLASLGLANPPALVRRRRGRARSARGGQGGGPSRSPRRGQSRRAPHATQPVCAKVVTLR